jgi:hypothetical protein
MNRTIAQMLICVATLLTAVISGCSRPTKFSTVLDGGFDPVREFRKLGYAVQTETRGEGIRNSDGGYAWESWCGVLARTNELTTCKEVAVVIRDGLNRSLNGSSLDELTVRAGRANDQPLTGMLRYNKDAVHGDMHVWLTPVASNTGVSYVIFVREERLK